MKLVSDRAVAFHRAPPRRAARTGRHAIVLTVCALGLCALAASVGPALAGALAFSSERGTIAALMASLLGFAFVAGRRMNALERAAHEDPVTRLGNRRSFDEVLAEELALAEASDATLSLVLFDIDHLKRVNDAHGHGCGDRVLRLLADAIRNTCRAEDAASRVGGDELALVLPRTRAAEAQIVVERIRSRLEVELSQLPTRLERGVTVCVGIADRESLGEATSKALYEAADQALTAAKSRGPNHVEVKAPARTSAVIPFEPSRAGRRRRRVSA